jgi:hypothetical protein
MAHTSALSMPAHAKLAQQQKWTRQRQAHCAPVLQVERLGDTKQSVRQKSCDMLVGLLQTYKADAIQERLMPYWVHKNWRMRHGLLQVRSGDVAECTVNCLG